MPAQSSFKIALFLGAVLFGALSFSQNPRQDSGSHDWPQFGFDARHSGNNVDEDVIGVRNVSALRQVYQVRLPAVVPGAPAFLSGVRTSKGRKDMLFATTESGDILGLDAQNGAVLWKRTHGPGSCRVNNGSQPCYTTSSPAIDPDRRFVYTYGLDGYVHKHRVGDGAEISEGGWPELCTLKPWNEKGSSALAIAAARDGKKYLYVANGGYLGDRGDYQGHITAINLADGTQRVFNAACSGRSVHFVQRPGQPDCPAVRSAIWARAGVVYDSDTDRIYMATGNGPFDPGSGDWGDSVLALNPDGTGHNGRPLDSYTPADQEMLEEEDLDLGSTAPAIFTVKIKNRTRHLAVQGGKAARLHLLDLENLSGRNGPGYTGGAISTVPVPQGGMVFTAPAVWVNPSMQEPWILLATGRGVSALRIRSGNNGILEIAVHWQIGGACTSPVVANGVLYCAGSGNIRALDPATGEELWEDAGIGRIHWQSPVVVSGRLYITDGDAQLTAYSNVK